MTGGERPVTPRLTVLGRLLRKSELGIKLAGTRIVGEWVITPRPSGTHCTNLETGCG